MNKKIFLQVTFSILTILIFGIIFCFSNNNSEKSEGQSLPIANKVVDILEKINKKQYENREKEVSKADHIIRKLAHFSIYTIAGISLMLCTNTFDLAKGNKIGLAILIGIAYAISDEIHQTFIPGRTAYVSDILIDSTGVIFGIIIVEFLYNLLENKYDKTIDTTDFKDNKNYQEKKW